MKFNKRKSHSSLDSKDVRLFCENLKKFKKRHPNFDLEAIIKKLYPNIDLKDVCSK